MLVSIVMPTLNQASFIEESLKSIIEQKIPDLEILVMDGASTDGTLDVLKKWQDQYPKIIHFTSQKDSGPAEALNQGFKKARGEIVGWLNSDDLYESKSISRAISFFKKNPSMVMVYGHGQHIDEEGHVTGDYPTQMPDVPIDHFLEGSFICQPTVFLKRNLIDDPELLDESLHLAFDFDWWIRIFKSHKPQIGFIKEVLAKSRLHANCLTQKERRLVAFEGMKVLKKHFEEAPVTWALTYIDEICSHYPFINDVRSLVKIVESFLTEIQSFVSPSNLKALIEQLQKDMRLILSSQDLYVDVTPDGWISQKGFIKLRNATAHNKQLIEVKLNAAWPFVKTLSLSVHGSSTKPFEAEFESKKPITLKLQLPNPMPNHEMTWALETTDFFIPKEHDSMNNDNRKLSFMVTSIKFIDA